MILLTQIPGQYKAGWDSFRYTGSLGHLSADGRSGSADRAEILLHILRHHGEGHKFWQDPSMPLTTGVFETIFVSLTAEQIYPLGAREDESNVRREGAHIMATVQAHL